MSTETKITPRPDGPLVVTDPPVLRHRGGDAIETKPVAALCRCGQSANKPFCDGSHAKAGFSSAPDGSKIRNTEIEYKGEVEGQDVTVSYTPVLCSHAGECARRAGDVFRPSEKPWVAPERGKLADIMAVMAACPSGALRVSIGETAPHHMTKGDVEIEIQQHGPYWVKNVALDAEFNGVGASHGKFVLCRCGLSKNKPFCDGTHHDEKWRDGSEG